MLQEHATVVVPPPSQTPFPQTAPIVPQTPQPPQPIATPQPTATPSPTVTAPIPQTSQPQIPQTPQPQIPQTPQPPPPQPTSPPQTTTTIVLNKIPASITSVTAASAAAATTAASSTTTTPVAQVTSNMRFVEKSDPDKPHAVEKLVSTRTRLRNTTVNSSVSSASVSSIGEQMLHQAQAGIIPNEAFLPKTQALSYQAAHRTIDPSRPTPHADAAQRKLANKNKKKKLAASASSSVRASDNTQGTPVATTHDLRKVSDDLVSQLVIPIAGIAMLAIGCGAYVFCVERKQPLQLDD